MTHLVLLEACSDILRCQRCGGPPLIFDHQMLVDSEAGTIYVSGGRVVDGDWESIKYSGLYSYDIRVKKWRLLS